MSPVRLEPVIPRLRVKHVTTRPPRSSFWTVPLNRIRALTPENLSLGFANTYGSAQPSALHSLVKVWAATQETLSSGYPTKRVSNQSPQLQGLARNLIFFLEASLDKIL